jgi:hypothetical protein
MRKEHGMVTTSFVLADTVVEAGAPLDFPPDHVMGAVDAASVGEAVLDLLAAGFAPVSVLAGAAGLRRLAGTAGGDGIGGLLRRLSLGLGGELDHLTTAQGLLRTGHALIDVEIDGDGHDDADRVRSVLVRHGGHSVVRFGRWTIEPIG